MDTLRRRGTIPADNLAPLVRVARRALRFWRLGAITAGITAAVALAGTLLLPARYRSDAVVFYQEGLQWRSDEAANPRRVGQRLRDTLLARAQLGRIVQEVGLFPKLISQGRVAEAVEEMRDRTAFRFEQGDIYVLSYTGDTPDEAMRVTARLTEVLQLENARLRTQQAELARKFLDTEKTRMEEEVAAKEREQVRFLAQHPEFAQDQASGVGVSLRASRGNRAGGRDGGALAALRREELRLRRQLATMSDGPTINPLLVSAKTDAETKLSDARAELQSRRARFTEQHPDVRAAVARLAEAEATYQRASAALEAAERQVGVTPATIRARLARVEEEIQYYLREPFDGREFPIERSDSAKNVVAVETEWARLTREMSELRERLQHLDTQQFTASMTASMVTSGQTGQILIIDPANLPVTPTGMSRKKRVALGAVIALALGLVAIVLRAVLDDLVNDRQDVDRLEFTETLAEVPRKELLALERGGAASVVPAAAPPSAPPPSPPPAPSAMRALPGGGRSGAATEALVLRPAAALQSGHGLTDAVQIHRLAGAALVDPRVFMLRAPEGAAAASFRILRHRLRSENPKTILVTSPRPGEGKSLTAVNLALALAETRRGRVVLVEANHRSPTIARWLGFTPPIDLSEQLRAHAASPAQPWAVVEAADPWLHVAALAPEGTGRPVVGRPLLACIAQLAGAGYSHVIVDGPAVLDDAEANVLEECADGILLTMRVGSSRSLELRRAAEQLGFGKLLGVVLLGV